MDGALSWLSSLIETFGKAFPRLTHVLATHEAVLFKRGKAKRLKSGIHWYWPVWSQVFSWPIARQTINPKAQTLTTQDGATVLANATVVFEISDIERALVDTFELENTITDVSQHGVKEIVQSHTFDELRAADDRVELLLTRAVRASLHPFGIKVVRAFLSDFAKTFVIRNVSCS